MNRFWDKVEKGEGCWEWLACVQKGYGRFKVGGKRGSMKLAHRVAWELANGPIPDGLNVLHRCDNGKCVRPAHLFLGTQMDNVRDCVAKGRYPSRVGERNGRARLSKQDAERIRERNAAGESYRKLGAEYGVNYAHIGHIVNRLVWQ